MAVRPAVVGPSWQELFAPGAGSGLPLEARVQVLFDVVGALVHVHADRDAADERGFHGRVTPRHILIGVDGSASLVFGKKAYGGLLPTQPDLGYLAPELLMHSGGPSAGADVFSLGVLLWEALDDGRLLPHRQAAAIVRLVTRGALPRPKLSAPWATPLADVAARCLNSNPSLRPADAHELWHLMGEHLSSNEEARAFLADAAQRHLNLELRSTYADGPGGPAGEDDGDPTTRETVRPPGIDTTSQILTLRPAAEPDPAGPSQAIVSTRDAIVVVHGASTPQASLVPSERVRREAPSPRVRTTGPRRALRALGLVLAGAGAAWGLREAWPAKGVRELLSPGSNEPPVVAAVGEDLATRSIDATRTEAPSAVPSGAGAGSNEPEATAPRGTTAEEAIVGKTALEATAVEPTRAAGGPGPLQPDAPNPSTSSTPANEAPGAAREAAGEAAQPPARAEAPAPSAEAEATDEAPAATTREAHRRARRSTTRGSSQVPPSADDEGSQTDSPPRAAPSAPAAPETPTPAPTEPAPAPDDLPFVHEPY